MSDTAKIEELPRPLPSLESREEISEVLRRAGEGDEKMLPLVRKLFDQTNGIGRSVAEWYGDCFAHTRDALVKHSVGESMMHQEGFRRKIDEVRDELAGPNPTPLERILCERVALTWYDAHTVDRRMSDPAGQPVEVARHLESRRDRSHRRFLAACRTLAVVRKLALPAIQVNVARQQVNVVGGSV